MSAPTPRPAGIPWCPCGQQKYFEWCSGCTVYVCRAPGHVHVCSDVNGVHMVPETVPGTVSAGEG